MSGSKQFRIGTSGWNYGHWKGPFYPENLSTREWLDFYMEKFHTVEINNSFYQLPKKQTFEYWKERSPEDFIFSVKASRYITHMKKLKDPQEPLSNFLKNAEALGAKLGPLLFQLPPRWKFNAERLETFLGTVPDTIRCALEFRDSTWWNEETYRILREYRAAFCIFELAGQHSPKMVTADFVYIRLHGPAGAYQGQYTDETLSGWAADFKEWDRQGKEVFCYFDNDQYGYAAQDALRLQEMTTG